MKIKLSRSLALTVLLGIVLGVVLWAILEGHLPIEKGGVLINVISIVITAIITYNVTTERDKEKFRCELLDKFLDSAGHWAYYTSTPEKDTAYKQSHEDYLLDLQARYHRIWAGVEDQSKAEEFEGLFDNFTKIESNQSDQLSSEDREKIRKAIQEMTDFLRRHYLK